MTVSLLGSSFRDPAGFLFWRDGRLLRQVNEVYRDEYERLLDSGLHGALVEQGLLIPHGEVGLELAASPGAYRVLEPERVPFISYPYEWSFGQLRDAALVTLRIQRMAMEHGMSLRDASAFNIQFRAGRPMLIDTLSFERMREGRPWVAYRQFCQHFLAPLALIAHRDARLGQLWLAHIDGVPLDLAARLLPRRARLRFGLLMHVVLQGRSVARHAGDTELPDAAKGRRFSLRAFKAIVESLESSVRRLKWRAVPPTPEDRSAGDLARLEELIDGFVGAVGPELVWDLAAAGGTFTRLAAASGAAVVSFDRDAATVESAYRRTAEDPDGRILPLVLDLANPTPAIGWGHRERQSLVERGPADMVLALGIVHHLSIGNNVPFPRLASFLREIGRSLVVEFIPKDDPSVAPLLAAREDVFDEYRREDFEDAFGRHFEIERRADLPDSGRVVYLMRAPEGRP